jgi:hypothetical protein
MLGAMNHDLQYMEQRWGTRVDLHAPVEMLTHDGQYMLASVKNASLSGAFVETAEPLPLYSRVALSPLARPDRWLEGCVVRVEPKGVALEWRDPGLQAVSTLLSLRPDNTVERLEAGIVQLRHSSVTRLHRHRAPAHSARQ